MLFFVFGLALGALVVVLCAKSEMAGCFATGLAVGVTVAELVYEEQHLKLGLIVCGMVFGAVAIVPVIECHRRHLLLSHSV